MPREEDRRLGGVRGAVRVLAIEALSEGEKFVWEVVIWIRAKTGRNHLMKNGEVPETLEALVAVGLAEREWKAVPAGRGPIPGELRWCYRLTPDGWKELWVVGDREEHWLTAQALVLGAAVGLTAVAVTLAAGVMRTTGGFVGSRVK